MRFTNRLFFFLFSLLSIPCSIHSQLNMVLVDSMDYAPGVNDICGWADGNGNEYALVGLSTGVSIVDVTNDSIFEVVFVQGVNNLWRDINTYSHYAYVSTEARDGLTIIDLQYLPDSVQVHKWNDTIPSVNGPVKFEKAHTLWTDENGLLYINGSNVNNGGVLICDLKNTPTDPEFLGGAHAIYSHDSYARDSVLYSAEIYDGNLSIYDIRDPQNVSLLGRVKTPNEFTHNSWLSDDSKFMFTTDERDNSFVTSYDITDFGNIIEVDRFANPKTFGQGNIPHNVYVWNDWIVVAYYANGTIILDADRPDNLIQVGDFDSWLGPEGGFNGVWGSFPWLPSGKILTSDRSSGLFVFEPNYVRACYLEGTVIDSVTRQPIFGAEVTIISDEILLPELSKVNGSFKMGKAIPGQYVVRVRKQGYYDKFVSLNFINGEVLSPEIELLPVPVITITGRVLDPEGNTLPNAAVSISGPQGYHSIHADDTGTFSLGGIYAGEYDVQAGVWGYVFEDNYSFAVTGNVDLVTTKGYRDDFDIDLGWEVDNSAELGNWTREVPTGMSIGNNWDCGSEGDSANDFGPFAYSTGPSISDDVETSEVTGVTTLTSPPMDFSQLIDPAIHFDYYLCEFPPNQFDGLSVWITNGIEMVLLENLNNDTIVGSWQSRTYADFPFTESLDQIRLILIAADTSQSFYLLKAHLDNFSVTFSGTSTNEVFNATGKVVFYPNPVRDGQIHLRAVESLKGQTIYISAFDMQGRLLQASDMSLADAMNGFSLPSVQGMCILRWVTEAGEFGTARIVKIQ